MEKDRKASIVPQAMALSSKLKRQEVELIIVKS